VIEVTLPLPSYVAATVRVSGRITPVIRPTGSYSSPTVWPSASVS
jgi:hypothetical protein